MSLQRYLENLEIFQIQNLPTPPVELNFTKLDHVFLWPVWSLNTELLKFFVLPHRISPGVQFNYG